MTQHPAIAALLNLQQELNAKLARMGVTAIQELLQPLWDSSVPVSTISWDQDVDATTNSFFSTHRMPRLLVGKSLKKVEYEKEMGVLAQGWTVPKKLTPKTRKLFEEKFVDFAAIPNEVMHLIFGDNTTVNVERGGRITTGPM